MEEAGVVTDVVGHRGQEGDDVMLDDLFDFVNPGRVEVRALPDALEGLAGDVPHLGMGLACQQFYLKPLPVTVLGAPDGCHLRTTVTFYHI